MTEFGPFVYREFDDWSEPQNWDVPTSVPGEPDEKKNAIKMIFNVNAKFDEELTNDTDLDTPIWQINQAAQGVWFGTQNTPDWRLYLNV